jgi:glycosyltransferase involved in cell wall biosynthesis
MDVDVANTIGPILDERPLRVIVLQRVITSYRKAIFRELGELFGESFCVIHGPDVPNTKVRNTDSLAGISRQQLSAWFPRLGGRTFVWHRGLFRALRNKRPDVIICEAESHLLGYLVALFYRYFARQPIACLYWCYVRLPGEPLRKAGLGQVVKDIFRRYFDGFITYSSFGSKALVETGVNPERVFTAVNVGDIKPFLEIPVDEQGKLKERNMLGIPTGQICALYSGTLDQVKKPELVLDIAEHPSMRKVMFLIAGSGPLQTQLEDQIRTRRLENVRLLGRVSDMKALYEAADLLIVPGRGGIVISEAMAAGLPCIVHQADGTEFDLVEKAGIGTVTDTSSADSFADAIQGLTENPAELTKVSLRAKEFMKNNMTTQHMASVIYRASRASHALVMQKADVR